MPRQQLVVGLPAFVDLDSNMIEMSYCDFAVLMSQVVAIELVDSMMLD